MSAPCEDAIETGGEPGSAAQRSHPEKPDEEPSAEPAPAPPQPAPAPPAPAPTKPARRGHPGRRAAIGDRRVLAAFVLLLPMLLVTAVDLARRGPAIVRGWWPIHGFVYVGFLALSGVLWGSLLAIASRRRGALRHAAALLFVAAFAWSFGAQHAFWTRFHAFQSRDSMELVESLAIALTGSLSASSIALHVGGFALAALGLVALARRSVRLRRRAARWTLLPFVLATGVGLVVPVSYREFQATTAEFLYAHGLVTRRRILADPGHYVFLQKRRPIALPRLEARPAMPRNVVFFLQEAQRFDVTCVAYDASCNLATQASNAALPGRIPFLETRSLGSSTIVSMQAIFTGLLPTARRERVQTAPLLWEYARAAGWHTAYYTSQHLMFANLHLWVDSVDGPLVTATHLDPLANLWCGPPDAKLADRFEAEFDSIPEPFVIIVHSANIHTPRMQDPNHAPFQPATNDKAKPLEMANHYKNVVHLSDLAMARIIERIRKSERGPRTVLVYTSDHGEAIGNEHKQGCEHGCSVYDEEVRVPFWIDAPRGTLTGEEDRNLRSLRRIPITHADLLPTLLDLVGVWDAPEIAEPRSWMAGHPLTRKARTLQPIPLSNVAWSWNYSPPSWGVMQGHRKLHVTKNARGYGCFDLTKDPREQRAITGGCPDLEKAANAFYGGLLPRDFQGLLYHPGWGEP